MNEFNVLLAAATNGTPSGSLFDALFARYIAPQDSWRELESPLPITILAAGEDLIDYRIYGANGGVGEPTENLIDANKPNVEQRVEVEPGEKYCLSKYQQRGALGRPSYDIYDENDNKIISDFLAVWMSASFTIPANGKYAIIYFGSSYAGIVSFVKGTAPDNRAPYPENYIPYGYKLPMVVRSGNIFDKSFEQGYYGAGDGAKGNSPRYVRSNDKIPVLSDETYTVTYICPKEGTPQSGVGTDSYIYFWAADSSYIGYQQIMEKGNQTFVTPSNAAYMAFTIGAGSGGSGTLSPSDVSNFMLNSGATALPYQPYSRTDIPIYIGDTPLAEEEYVDFGEQKIYRMEGGTLTPTDPPVPIPALPTIEGETIIDYNPSTTPAVEPEKMYIKYKPQ